MQSANPVTLRWLSAIVIVAAGCSSSSPFSTPPGSSGATRTSHPSSMFASSPSNSTDGPANVASTSQTSRPSSSFQPASTRESGGNAITATFKKTTSAIGSALKIEPKVVPAYDPTSITGAQPEVGSEVYFQAGRVLQQQGKLVEAERQFEMALEKSPRDVRVLVSMARLRDQQGMLEAAEQTYRQALEFAPANGTVLNDLGLFYAKRQRVDAAVDVLRKAVQAQPSNRRYRNNLASVLLDANRRDEAFAVLSYELGQAEAHYNLGYLLAERGATDAAAIELRTAVNLNPTFAEAQSMLASMGATEKPRHLPPVSEAGPYHVPETSPAQQIQHESAASPSRAGDFVPSAQLPNTSTPMPPF